MDFSALYRLEAVLNKFNSENLTVAEIHKFVQKNQALFLRELDKKHHPLFNRKSLLVANLENHGHFLTFELPSVQATQEWVIKLAQRNIKTDSRGTRLRFGFGLYHDDLDIKKVVDCLTN